MINKRNELLVFTWVSDYGAWERQYLHITTYVNTRDILETGNKVEIEH
jgi:hypothetical protein